MKGAELILRYLAFRHDRAAYKKPLSSFLDQFSSKHRLISEADANEWGKEFDRTVSRVEHAFGKLAFRIYEHDSKSSTGFNSALYDAQMIGFAETKNQKILQGKYDVKRLQIQGYRLFEDEKFLNSVRQATSDELSVKTRIETYLEFLDGY